MHIKRFDTNPIITADLSPTIGTNINGPSLIRAPEWLPNRLGEYYLYFAHHHGTFIRLAYADVLAGPWHIYEPGTLQLDQTPCAEHIASPDIHIDQTNRRLILYYHGPMPTADHPNAQKSLVATSTDGIHFTSGTEILGPSYFRIFRHGDWTYALAMPGQMLRSRDGFHDFERGPRLFDANMRHAALLKQDETLYVFYSIVGDAPEHIVRAQIDLGPDWQEWQVTEPETVLLPEMEYEGAHLPDEPSFRGWIEHPVRQLRDPAIFQEDGHTYLLYSVAGENGLAIGELLI